MQLGNAVHHDYGYQLAQNFFSEPKEKTDFINDVYLWQERESHQAFERSVFTPSEHLLLGI